MDTAAAAASASSSTPPALDTADFRASLVAKGYDDEILERQLRAGTTLDTHTHSWDTRLMVLEGSLTVGHEGKVSTMGPGDTFEIGRNVPHTEAYAEAVETRVLIGRRHR